MNKKNDIREQKTRTGRKNSKKNNDKKVEINKCIVCGREIKKGEIPKKLYFNDLKTINRILNKNSGSIMK